MFPCSKDYIVNEWQGFLFGILFNSFLSPFSRILKGKHFKRCIYDAGHSKYFFPFFIPEQRELVIIRVVQSPACRRSTLKRKRLDLCYFDLNTDFWMNPPSPKNNHRVFSDLRFLTV